MRRAGGIDAVEIVHRDGTITRLSDDTVLTEPPRATETGSGLAVAGGSSWHRVAGADHPFRIEVPNGSVSTADGVFTVVCESSGSSFVVCLDGSVRVEAGVSAADLHAMEAVDLSPDGVLGYTIEVSDAELRTDPWVAMNLELGVEAADVTASARAAAIPTTVEREEPAVEAEAPVEGAAAAAVAEAEVGWEVEEAERAGAEGIEAAEVAEVEAPVEEAEAPAEAAVEEEAPAEEEPAAALVTEPEPELAEAAAPAEAEAPAEAPVEEPAAALVAEPEEELEAEELERDEHVVVVGRGPTRQPTLWVALVLALIAAALFALGRQAENKRPVAGTVIDHTRVTTTTVGPATTVKPPATTAKPPATTAATTAASSTAPPTTQAPTTTAAPPPGTTYDVSLTKCSQSGSTIAAEGAITNKSSTPQSYRITVAFLGADQKKVAEAVATVENVQPKQRVTWKGTGTYGGDLKGSGGCETERVDLV